MNIILISKKHNTSRYLSFSKFFMATFIVVALSIPVGAGLGGYYYGAVHGGEHGQLNHSVMNELETQRQDLLEAKLQAESELKGLTRRVAEMQARITRVDALGERLIDVAKLPEDEFDFSQVPPVGGPSDADLGEAIKRPDFLGVLDQLTSDIDQREQQLEVLENLMENQKLQNDVFLAGRPIKRGWMSSRFGKRTDPFTGRLAWHKGMDFAGKDGSDIVTVASGVVTWAGDRYGYGQMVEVSHGNNFSTRYAHCKQINVKVGDVVHKGEVVAQMGSTGRSTGPHVHFEVWKDGKAVDPTRYIQRASR